MAKQISLTILFIFTTFILAPAEEGTSEIHAMSFNIRLGVAKDGPNHWTLRKDLVFQVIKDHNPDVVGLQEAWKFQIDEMLSALPDYAMLGRSRQADPEEGEWCPIFYRKDSVKLLDSDTFWLSDQPEEAGSMTWGNQIPRICTWALFQDKQSGKSFYLYNTHFDHKSQPSREKSAKLCLKKIAERKETNKAAILLGDFNAGEDNPASKTLSSAMIDTYGLLKPDVKERGTFSAWNGKKDGNRIDYVFVTKGDWKIIDARILYDHSPDGRYPSDHYPVDAKLQLK